MNATDAALLLHLMREKYTPEQVVTELERVAAKHPAMPAAVEATIAQALTEEEARRAH